VVKWTIKEGQSEIAPGVIYDDYWGFEGKVPGPLLRVREGDLVEIHLTNGLSSTHSHNIDFHFVSGPGGGATALSVAPGQTAVLEARAMMAGFYMFHCASPDIPIHIANGMYGFVLVEPAEGLPAAGKEFYVVQSEIYAHNGDKGHQSFDIDRGERMDPQYVVFNGAVGSMMKDNAPHVPLNQSVRIYIGNAGPNFVSSFHVIGQILDNVYREGDLVSPPAHGLQTTLVPAGGSTIVEFTPRVPGTFLLVDHSIFRLHRGAVASLIVDGGRQVASEIYNPITAAGRVEMSADAHLGHGMNSTATAQVEKALEKSTSDAQPISTYGGIPPASDPTKFAQMVDANPAPEPPASPAGPGATVRILPGAGNYNTSNTYEPTVLTVKRGTAVTWLNTDPGMVHNVVDDKAIYQSALIQTDQSWSHTFNRPGVFPYHCLPHPWMKGMVVVK
jgi:copper-containing nitrite reductase